MLATLTPRIRGLHVDTNNLSFDMFYRQLEDRPLVFFIIMKPVALKASKALVIGSLYTRRKDLSADSILSREHRFFLSFFCFTRKLFWLDCGCLKDDTGNICDLLTKQIWMKFIREDSARESSSRWDLIMSGQFLGAGEKGIMNETGGLGVGRGCGHVRLKHDKGGRRRRM